MTARVTGALPAGEVGPVDGLARLLRAVDRALAWKLAREHQAEARFHRRRRAARRRRRALRARVRSLAGLRKKR